MKVATASYLAKLMQWANSQTLVRALADALSDYDVLLVASVRGRFHAMKPASY